MNVPQDSGSLLGINRILMSSEMQLLAVVASSMAASQVDKKVETSSSCKTKILNKVAKVWSLVVPSQGSYCCFSFAHIAATDVSFRITSGCFSCTFNIMSNLTLLSSFRHSFHSSNSRLLGSGLGPVVNL